MKLYYQNKVKNEKFVEDNVLIEQFLKSPYYKELDLGYIDTRLTRYLTSKEEEGGLESSYDQEEWDILLDKLLEKVDG